jgi:TonB family protein
VAQGNTPVETGARGQGAGLTFGGGGTGGEMRIMEFCCPEYVQLLTSWIDRTWRKDQPERGTTEMRFTIGRDGLIGGIEIVEPSGSSVLDRVSRAAIVDLPPLPLPPKYPNSTLTVRIRFPYSGS